MQAKFLKRERLRIAAFEALITEKAQKELFENFERPRNGEKQENTKLRLSAS